MTADAQTTIKGLLRTLEGLQTSPDDAIYATKAHLNLLKSLNTLLGSTDEIMHTDAERILKMCLQYKMDMQCAPYMLSIKSSLIRIRKTKPFIPDVDFFPSALAVLEFLRTSYGELKANHVRKLSLQVLMSHPEEALSKLVKDHSPTLIETFALFLSAKATLDFKVESFRFLQLLNSIPAYEKSIFVKQGIQLWLSVVIPVLIKVLLNIEDEEKVDTYLRNVEVLSEELIKHDYFEYPEWENFLENVVDPKKFPMCIAKLLEKGKTTWYRIWIVIIKLLQGYVTKNYGTFCTPINSMLPVVETAFKRDSTQKVRAFACWNELIKNFANETKATCIGKRVKLIVIPLKLNNAKTEDAALAKFDTWWLFIRSFKSKLEAFTDEILIPFIHFLLGKENSTKPSFWPGQVSARIRKKCLEAFVEVLGHSDCESRCTYIEPLEGRVITTVMLTDHFNDWVYALKSAVKVVAMCYNQESKSNIRCIWKSFVLLLTELMDNTIRRDCFNDLINLMSAFVQDSVIYKDYLEIVVMDLALPMFSDNRMLTLLNSNSEDHRPMHTIVKIITDKAFDSYYDTYDQKNLMKLFHPLVTCLLTESLTQPGHMVLLLEELPQTDSSLKLWTALVQGTSELDLCVNVLSAILKWPLKILPVLTDVKDAALAWHVAYEALHDKLDNGFEEEIDSFLTKPLEESDAVNYFVLFALIAVLKHKPDEEKMAKLEALTYKMNSYKEFEPLIPPLVETLAFIIDKVSDTKYENLAQITVNCVNNVFKVIDEDEIFNANETLIRSENVLNNDKANILYLNKTVLSDTILSAMKTYLAKCKSALIKKEIINNVALFEETDHKPIIENPEEALVVSKEFASPKIQENKKNKKKEASIVSTVVENGEEYVVVKSNWKFNPKNLTENQKEKFQRKRDIPALYQDLSQSQDEFRLSTWKTDSQDTSLSSSKSSKSATNNGASEALKTMPSSNIVPKIMENIMDSAKSPRNKTSDNTSPVQNDKVLKVDKVVTPKGTKSPRMALKDRVFRNVRNLIEKSAPARNEKLQNFLVDPVCKSATLNIENDKINTLNQMENVSKSPVLKPKPIENEETNKEDHEALITISPSADKKNVFVVTAKKDSQNITLVCTPVKKKFKEGNKNIGLQSGERPARLKRKPKKFDDSLMLALKKSRQSNESQADSEEPWHQPEITRVQIHTLNDKNEINNTANKASITVTTDGSTNVMECDTIKDNSNKESHRTEKAILSPTTMITDRVTEKSPEKPTALVEVPSDRDKASHGIEDKAEQHVILVEESQDKTPSVTTNIVKDVNKISSVTGKKSVNVRQVEKISTSSNKFKKAPAHTEISPKRDLTCVVFLDKAKILNEVKSNKSTTNETRKEPDVVTPVNKVIKATDSKKITTDLLLDETNEKFNPITSPASKTKEVEPLKSEVDGKETQVDDKTIEGLITPKNNVKDVASKSSITTSLSKGTKGNDLEKAEITTLEQNETDNGRTTSITSPTSETKDEPKSAVKRKVIQIVNISEGLVTPKNKVKDAAPKSTIKKTKKSRIEKELMIDMVEGHPFLKSQSERRLTRKKIMEVENSSRRKSLADKLNSSKLETKSTKNLKEKKISPSIDTVKVVESQDKQTSLIEDSEPPCSEDIIESSQDSTMTTISVKSTKRSPPTLPIRQPVVSIEKINIVTDATQDLIKDIEMTGNQENHEKTDIEISQNKTAEVDTNITNLTENMDTEPIEEGNMADLIVLENTESAPIVISLSSVVGPETQELAEADTQPNDPETFREIQEYEVVGQNQDPGDVNLLRKPTSLSLNEQRAENAVLDAIQGLPEASIATIDDATDVSSPFKDDDIRKQDFLNNTLEISPIKIRSPERQEKSPSPETSSDFVVIKLTSPVHSNGEPFEKLSSPEFFTEDKVSPEKRDASPPRVEVSIADTSPSSSLSLKKNRPQGRPSGRAAQMLDLLCVNSDLKITKVPDRVESEEKRNGANTPVRRNLRILYSSVGENDSSSESNLEEDDNFLKLQRSLPTVTSSPSGPILKRKLIDITDETTTSPASKRKRVSFHDPPVSTSISVHKYIEPLSLIRSPQSSSKKRRERQTRSCTKLPKRLENAFNLDSVLSKTVESFIETSTPTDDTQNTSLEITPVVEIVKISELNDIDPFYPYLIDCKDPISIIATELSSPIMRDLFLKELEGKVETIGDLAKMTELDINRLCIKAPKIKVAKKVLADYFTRRSTEQLVETVIEEAFSEPMTESRLVSKSTDIEMQTDKVEVSCTEMQTMVEPMVLQSSQTENVCVAHTSIQTDKSGSETIEDTTLSLVEREDFIENQSEESLKKMAEKLSTKCLFDLLMMKSENLTKHQNESVPEDKINAELSFLKDYLCERYTVTDLITLSTEMLHKVNTKLKSS